MEEKKIRVTVPEIVYSMLNSDINDFNINKNKLCNIIFSFYNETAKESSIGLTPMNTKTIQFNLSVINKHIFDNLKERKKITKEAVYFRNIFFEYLNQPKFKREIILCRENYELINESIKTKRKLKIKYQDSVRIIEPYFIKNSDAETRNYVFCYCGTHNEYRNYRLINFKAISIINEHFQKEDFNIISDYRQNFDPFLSYGKKVKVWFSDKGKMMLQKMRVGRPKLLHQSEDVFTFECSAEKAKIYFPQFLNEAEILEPTELRIWFKDMFKKALKNYN